jgi:hypothetical protein
VLSESVRLASTVPLPREPTQAIREMYALARSFARSRHVEIRGQRLPFFIATCSRICIVAMGPSMLIANDAC